MRRQRKGKTMGYAKDGSLQCDGWCGHAGTVTHIDEKGYAYCTPCGIQRKASHRCRKLTGAEIKRLQAGLTISYERPRCIGELRGCYGDAPAAAGHEWGKHTGACPKVAP